MTNNNLNLVIVSSITYFFTAKPVKGSFNVGDLEKVFHVAVFAETSSQEHVYQFAADYLNNSCNYFYSDEYLKEINRRIAAIINKGYTVEPINMVEILRNDDYALRRGVVIPRSSEYLKKDLFELPKDGSFNPTTSFLSCAYLKEKFPF